MFGYYNSIQARQYDKVLSIYDLIHLIVQHPKKEQIAILHNSPYKSDEYCKLKEQMPVITPAGIFRNAKIKNEFIQVSGYLYFDIDAQGINGSINDYRNYIIQTYKENICLLGKSIGGRGLFFYVKIDGLTADNYESVYSYLQTGSLKEIVTDESCKNINRCQFIPYDPELYVNLSSSSIQIPPEIINLPDKIADIQRINKRDTCYTSSVSFMPIDEVLRKIKWVSYKYEGDNLFEINCVDFTQLYIPKSIKDGKKHTTYRSMVNVLLQANSGIDVLTVLSFINYVNENHTTKKMRRQEMINTVTAEYNRIIETGEVIASYRLKALHFNSEARLSGEEKRKLASKVNGLVKVYGSVLAISAAKEQLLSNGKKLTTKNIAALTNLSPKTVQRHQDKSQIEIAEQICSLNSIIKK